jgi:hypothetical protein
VTPTQQAAIDELHELATFDDYAYENLEALLAAVGN